MTQNRLIELLEDLIPKEGVQRDVIKDVTLFNISNSSPRTPQTYDPGIIIIARGQKRIFVGDEIYTYDPLNYLVLTVPLPLECEVLTPENQSLLGFTIKVDPTSIGEMMLELDETTPQDKTVPRGIYDAPLNQQMIDASVRLLQTLSTPSDRRLLGPMIVREIIYRVLTGEKGDALRALAYRNQHFFQIARILDKIHQFYHDKLDLKLLARDAGMSISLFHSVFKSVTNTSPLQYIKSVRLHKARFLMVEEGFNASDAAYRVGYESASQFNREYKRLFGITPGKDAVFSAV